MKKKKYISPAITVYESTPCAILANSTITEGSENDYNQIGDNEIYGE